MRVCTVYLKSGQSFDLHGSEFSVTYGTLEGDIRSIKWEELDTKKADPLWIDFTHVAAVVVRDK